MKTLELYISTKVGGMHNFQVLEGLRRSALEPSFASTDSDTMLAYARKLLAEGADFEPRLRVYDASHRVLKGGDVTRWVKLDVLRGWVLPNLPETAEAAVGGLALATA